MEAIYVDLLLKLVNAKQPIKQRDSRTNSKIKKAIIIRNNLLNCIDIYFHVFHVAIPPVVFKSKYNCVWF